MLLNKTKNKKNAKNNDAKKGMYIVKGRIKKTHINFVL